ncbi:AAA family ATPase [Paenibacillus sp. 1011MAR3C5]|uniref:ATP-binding protein n=1 Tax=Paenibacillus sp. 1011MAR3C5 TaxID=1675787 RepID=UPI000E6B9347|nr:ATP-binding protein [Paenibacillus sp. 1011MAR3C5]RJE82779.1 AAA family ATPase [Paenibacillus sp. 1011MAR3C5]
MTKIIFVCGGHGVGKTYFCKMIVEQYQFTHHSSSQLITSKKQIQFPSNKRVEKINENQDYLIDAINELHIDNVLLLDGHFCLLNEKGEIVKLPKQTFRTLAPVGIILLKDTSEEILARLTKRDSMVAFDKKLVEALQREEIKYANEISSSLGNPLLIHNVNDPYDKVHEFIKSIY